MGNLIEAVKAFWTVLMGGARPVPSPAVGESVKGREVAPAAKPKEKKTEPVRDLFEDGAVYALVLLQRSGRLVDFLQEDISGFDDAQVGAAVRQIHTDCRKAVAEHFRISPIVDGSEGQPFSVPAGFDPSEMRLTGDVPSGTQLKGTLQHKGWKAAAVSLPERSAKVNPRVVQPAEIGF